MCGMRLAISVLAGCLLAAGCTSAPPAPATPPSAEGFTLTVLHNNDGESQLRSAAGRPDFGGIHRFAALEARLEAEAAARGPVVTVSSGDNFLAGPEFRASLDKGPPHYDAVGLARVGYDAVAVGNHEFDFGPDVLADFMSGLPAPFLSANLDASAEPRLAGRIAPSTVVDDGGRRIGIVGATTPALASISSPRDVTVDPDVRGRVQAEVDRLTADGVTTIVLISHLQSVVEDRALVAQLRGVDVAVAGGGDELLADPADLLLPDDAASPDLPYPLRVPDADGREVPVVTTAGGYGYLGRLVVTLDGAGNVTGVDDAASGPVRVSGVAPDAVAPDPVVTTEVVDPVAAFVAGLEQTVVARTEVPLDGTRARVRTVETNLGNLVADALLAAGKRHAAAYGAKEPTVALQNGGGIRNDSVLPAGPVTRLDTFDVAPFPNFVAVVPDVPRTRLKELLENAVSAVDRGDGRFAQVAGFRFTWDATGTAQVTADDGTVTTPGTRVTGVVLEDNTPIVTAGQVVDGPPLTLATQDFSARGGDQWPLRGLPSTSLGVTYQEALAEHLAALGTVTAAVYPEGENGRVTRRN